MLSSHYSSSSITTKTINLHSKDDDMIGVKVQEITSSWEHSTRCRTVSRKDPSLWSYPELPGRTLSDFYSSGQLRLGREALPGRLLWCSRGGGAVRWWPGGARRWVSSLLWGGWDRRFLVCRCWDGGFCWDTWLLVVRRGIFSWRSKRRWFLSCGSRIFLGWGRWWHGFQWLSPRWGRRSLRCRFCSPGTSGCLFSFFFKQWWRRWCSSFSELLPLPVFFP